MKKVIALLLAVVFVTISFSQTEQVIVPNGHSLLISKVILDDQQHFLYSAEKEKIIMWDAQSGKQLFTFPARSLITFGVNHKGDKLVYSTGAQLVCYSTVTGKKLWTTDYAAFSFCSIIFTKDDSKALMNNSRGIAWFDINTGNHDLLKEHVFDNSYTFLYNNKDGSTYVLVNDDGWQIRNAETGAITAENKFPQSQFKSWYLPFNNIVASCVNENDGSVLTFQNAITGQVLKKLTSSSRSDDVALIPSKNDNHFLLLDGYDENAKSRIYNASTFAPEKTFGNFSPVHYQPVQQGFYLGAEKKVFLSAYNTLFARDMGTGKMTTQFKRTVANLGFDVFNSLEYNQSSGELNIMTDDSVLKRIDIFRMKAQRSANLQTDVENVAISPGGDSVAIFASDKTYIKNINTNKMVVPNAGFFTGSIERALFSFSGDGKNVFYADKSKINNDLDAVYKWDLTSNTKQEILQYNDITAANYSADKLLLSAVIRKAFGKDYYATIINTNTGQEIFKKTVGGAEGIFAVASGDKSKVIILTGTSLTVYDINSGAQLQTSDKLSARLYTKMAVNYDGSAVYLGTISGEIVGYTTNGKQLFDVVGHNSDVRTVLLSPDDKILYSIAHDQTIKVWNASNGDLLGTLYLFNDGNDYVFVGKDGRFDGSPEGIKKLYYLKNRNIIPLDLVYEKYYTPNLYQRLVNGEIFPPLPDEDLKNKPLVKIQYAEKQRNLEVDNDVPSYQNTTGLAVITVTASTEDDAIDEIRLFLNGKVLNLATRNLIVEDDKSKTATKKYSVSLLPGVNEIRAVALNTQRTESNPDIINVVYNNGAANTNVTPVVNKKANVVIDKVDKNATMHLVVVGINAYKNPKMNLNYALADATAFKDEVEKDAKTVISHVQTYFVTDDAADKTGITKAMQQVQQNAKAQDVFVFYYAGHGVVAGNKEFYLVPNDVTELSNVDEALKEHGIAAKDLQQYAINIQAQKQLFILDACQSAAAFADMLSSDGNQQKNIALVARSTGTHWMAASGAQQFANEFATLGHGAFTYVLLQALKGEAANNKMITVDGLKDYMQNGVPALMKKYNGSQQTPASYGFGNDFPVEVIK